MCDVTLSLLLVAFINFTLPLKNISYFLYHGYANSEEQFNLMTEINQLDLLNINYDQLLQNNY